MSAAPTVVVELSPPWAGPCRGAPGPSPHIASVASSHEVLLGPEVVVGSCCSGVPLLRGACALRHAWGGTVATNGSRTRGPHCAPPELSHHRVHADEPESTLSSDGLARVPPARDGAAPENATVRLSRRPGGRIAGWRGLGRHRVADAGYRPAAFSAAGSFVQKSWGRPSTSTVNGFDASSTPNSW